MRTVTVNVSKSYDILIGSGLLSHLGEQARLLGKAQKVCIVSDSNVYPLHGNEAESSLKEAGFETFSFVFPAGEESKNPQTYLSLLNALAENKLTRTDLIVALGGGVVGDLAGFAAATYLRGIRFIQVPTTLLAAVDSSVGGKTAIDLPAGKNLAGAFCQPSLVLCDTLTLDTLPDAIFRDGCSEVIKYGILYDEPLFSYLEQQGLSFGREAVIERCVQLKRDVVTEDEFDTGARMKLNLGHTIGHGIEAKSQFAISHGQAVAIGTAIVTQAAARNGLCSKEDCHRILHILQKFGLPVHTVYSADDLYAYTLSDKKRAGGNICLIIPRKIGKCDIYPMDVTSLKGFIQSGLSMDIRILPRKLAGTVDIIPSKSMVHRLLICAAFGSCNGNDSIVIRCPEVNRDIEATAQCLRDLNAADIIWANKEFRIYPKVRTLYAKTAHLNCHDSGSTLRFLLPVVGALGIDTTFHLEGRLAKRPLSPLWEEMERMGCVLSRPTTDTVRCQGKLRTGNYIIDGGVSSQFVSGLLLACGLIPGKNTITVTGKTESRPYITMTQDAMNIFGVISTDYVVDGTAGYCLPAVCLTAEGDWSNGAFFLAANALGCHITVNNLDPNSHQGDRAVASLLPELKERITISAADIPDLVPVLSVVAACNKGAVFTDIQRLRLKESDRVASTISMLRTLGGNAEATDDTLTVYGTGLTGGTVDAVNDHRIAMAAAIASTVCTEPVSILGAECVKKSYPRFWWEFTRLGGYYEQYIR